MIHGLVSRTSVAEEELDACRRELAQVLEKLAENELELATLKSELSRFHYRYFQAIGSKYVELDELRACISRHRAERMPQDEHSVSDARNRRFDADRSARAYQHYRQTEPPPMREKTAASGKAKKLFREIAGQIHPDRAENEKSRNIRTALMAELNAAYAANDVDRMQTILEEWRTNPESVAGNDSAAELLRIVKTITRLKQRIEQTERETHRLRSSTVSRLMQRVREASLQGRDLLNELATEIEQKIALARRELKMEELLKKNEHDR